MSRLIFSLYVTDEQLALFPQEFILQYLMKGGKPDPMSDGKTDYNFNRTGLASLSADMFNLILGVGCDIRDIGKSTVWKADATYLDLEVEEGLPDRMKQVPIGYIYEGETEMVPEATRESISFVDDVKLVEEAILDENGDQVFIDGTPQFKLVEEQFEREVVTIIDGVPQYEEQVKLWKDYFPYTVSDDGLEVLFVARPLAWKTDQQRPSTSKCRELNKDDFVIFASLFTWMSGADKAGWMEANVAPIE